MSLQMATNPGAVLIQLILSKISQGDVQAVVENLSRLPIGVISKDKAETLLAWFLDRATSTSNSNIIREIITVFDVARIRSDPLPAITNIFLNPNLKRETLEFVLASFPEKTPIDLYVDLVNMGDDVSALKVAGILNTFFPEIIHEDWTMLVSLTEDVEDEEYENQLLRAFFQTKQAETDKVIPRPLWIKDNIPEATIDYVPELPTVKEAVDMLTDYFKKKGLDLKTDKTKMTVDQIITQYAISPISEKIRMLEEVHPLPQFDDSHIFREFGPVNTIYTTTQSIESHICTKYGGCRMLLCSEFETLVGTNDEFDIMSEQEVITDWFRSSCDQCLRKIKKRHYAVRQPLLHGGWRGCYCSMNCLTTMMELREPLDSFNLALIVRVRAQLKEFGIRER